MQGTSWAAGLELVGDDERLVAHAGLLPLRLLAERTGLRAGLSAAMRKRDSSPLYDRGQVLADLALVLIAGGEAISDYQALDAPGAADRAGSLDADGVAGPVRGRGPATFPAQRRRDRVPPALAGTARGPAGGIPVAESRRP